MPRTKTAHTIAAEFERQRLESLEVMKPTDNAEIIRELVEALESLYNAVDSCVELTPEVMLRAKAALAKAKARKE